MRRIFRRVYFFLIKFFSLNKPNSKLDDGLINAIASMSSGKADIVFDIGAYHGEFSVSLSKKIEIKNVYCFEPNPDAFKILSLKLNGPVFHHYQLALSDFSGTAPFYLNQFDETNSLLQTAKTNSPIDLLTTNKSSIAVKVETIDSFCIENGIFQISILKIDTQGNTLNVLKGACALLKSNSIKLIQCEVEFIEIYKQEPLFHKIVSYLEQSGYTLYSLYNIHYSINNRISWADALFYIDDKKN